MRLLRQRIRAWPRDAGKDEKLSWGWGESGGEVGETDRGREESSTDSGVDDEAKVPLLFYSLVASFSPLQSTAGRIFLLMRESFH